MKILERYSITHDQIYTITCDNAKNMVKMVDLFNVVEPDTLEEEENDNDELQELNEGKCQILSILINIISYVTLLMFIEIYIIFCLFSEDNSELQANDCLELENLVTASVFDKFPMTTCVRCAVRTFQLSVYDTL